MRTLIAVVLAAAVLMPAAAFAGSSTDAALGLGAFAVFNQMLGGVGVFQRYQAPPPVVIAPPPPPPVVYQYQYYAPAPVYAYPAPVYVVPEPRYYYAPAPVMIYQHQGHHRGHHWRHGDDDD